MIMAINDRQPVTSSKPFGPSVWQQALCTIFVHPADHPRQLPASSCGGGQGLTRSNKTAHRGAVVSWIGDSVPIGRGVLGALEPVRFNRMHPSHRPSFSQPTDPHTVREQRRINSRYAPSNWQACCRRGWSDFGTSPASDGDGHTRTSTLPPNEIKPLPHRVPRTGTGIVLYKEIARRTIRWPRSDCRITRRQVDDGRAAVHGREIACGRKTADTCARRLRPPTSFNRFFRKVFVSKTIEIVGITGSDPDADA